MGWLKTILLTALLFSLAPSVQAAEIVAMRAYENKGFHRLTLIITEEVPLKAVKGDDSVIIQMRDISTTTFKDLPRTEVIHVRGLRKDSDDSGQFTALDVGVPRGSKVTQTVKSGPFRVILDVYPPPGFGAIKAVDPYMKAVLLEQDASRVMAFNDSWRWVYRKKVVELLTAELHESLPAEAVSAALGVDASDRAAAESEAARAALSLRAAGRADEAALLDAVMLFYAGRSDPASLEMALRPAKDSAVKGLGYLLIAGHYEKKGFFPEASGYYTLAEAGTRHRPVRSLALFRKARLLFFQHKYADAKEAFRKSASEGHAGSGLWLASVCVIRGETDAAWQLSGAGKSPPDGTDPITALSLADMNILKGRFNEARFLLASLRSRYEKDSLVWSYLLMREADAYFLEGRKDHAVSLYAGAMEKLRGEPWALMSLALADAHFVTGTREALEKAEKIFDAVARGSHEASIVTNVRLIATRVVLGRFEQGYEDIKRFHASYPTSPLRQDVTRLSDTLFYGWIDALTSSGDHVGAVKLFSETQLSIPFGKRAETSLRIAKSYAAIGLKTEAARNLDIAVKLGHGALAEEAMLLLADTYIDQNDINSAERLMKAFGTRFPRSKKTAEKELISARLAFARGEYERSAAVNAAQGDAGLSAMKAKSLARIGRQDDAAGSFERAAAAYESKGDERAARGAWLRSADARYASGDIRGAIEAYRKGLDKASAEDKEDRSWALYRIARCYSRLGMKDMEAEALSELKAVGGDLSQWTSAIFEEAKGL